MKRFTIMLSLSFFVFFPLFAIDAIAKNDDMHDHHYLKNKNSHNIQLGPRPFFLVNDMDESPLKSKLKKCEKGPFKKSDFSIGHRGAPLQFPEHTKESYVAAAKMGAGILECDVTFTSDKELVCRHSQCDLHTTTNILATPLASKCSIPFTPAVLDADGNVITPATAKCCTSDISLAEFKSLKGKMDAADNSATTAEAYMGGTAKFRTDLYTGGSKGGTLLTHKESIALFKSLNTKMTPELKSPSVAMPYNGYTQEDYAQQMIDEYKEANVDPSNVFPQSFKYEDVLYWVNEEPEFGEQAVYLDGRYSDQTFNVEDPITWTPSMQQIASDGVNIIAPPLWMLVTTDPMNKLVPSIYAEEAKASGLDIITWTLERSGFLENGGGWYYQTVSPAINNDGDMLNLLDTLAKDVGVLGVFSDWPATTTYYANCMKL